MIEYGRPKAEARGKYENIASRKGAKTRRKDEGRRKKRMEPQIDIDKHEYNVNHINLMFLRPAYLINPSTLITPRPCSKSFAHSDKKSILFEIAQECIHFIEPDSRKGYENDSSVIPLIHPAVHCH
jgi:hypothetical protein